MHPRSIVVHSGGHVATSKPLLRVVVHFLRNLLKREGLNPVGSAVDELVHTELHALVKLCVRQVLILMVSAPSRTHREPENSLVRVNA